MSCHCHDDHIHGHNHCHDDHTHAHNHCHDNQTHSHNHNHKESTWMELIIPASGSAICIVSFFLIPDSFFIKWPLFILGYILLSFKILYGSITSLLHGSLFDENFLMSLAAIGAIVTGEYVESVAVMFLFQLGEFLQDLASDKSRKNIEQAMNLKADTANLISNDGIRTISSAEVSPEDSLLIKPGEKVPVDAIVTEGISYMDTSSLTGESLPVCVSPGDEVLSGFINTSAPIKVKALRSYDKSTAAKILELVETATLKKSPVENFITQFAKVYTPVVVIAAILLSFLPPIISGNFDFMQWIYRACGFLVVSCPCALVISVPLGFFSALGTASSNGIVVKGSNYISALNKIDTVVFDKTGTLTKGSFSVTDIVPAKDFSKEMLLKTAAIVEQISSHPIAVSITNEYKRINPDWVSGSDISEKSMEIPGRGIYAEINVDGIPVTVYAGSKSLMKENNLPFTPSKESLPGTVIYISSAETFFGYIRVSDEIKDDSAPTVKELKRLGYNVIMLTGDHKESASYTAKQLGIENYYYELLPSDKVSVIEKIKKENRKVLFVGDGINDAPVLALSDIGTAMGAIGSDAAIEASDMVIMNDELSKLLRAFEIAKCTSIIVKENIYFSIGIKMIILVLMAAGLGNLWLSIFADVGVALIAILNSLRILRLSRA